MSVRTFGYARVSTKEQNEARQMDALRGFPVEEKNIFVDKQSGKDFQRPSYTKLIRQLRPGDTLVILSIDRLGRNYDEILKQWRILTKEKMIDIVVLDMPLLDTRNRDKGLTGVFIADLVLQILSYVAQSERENIRKRQAEGIEAAHRRGIRFGRPPKEVPENFEEVVARWHRKEITMAEALAETELKQTHFFKKIKELGLNNPAPQHNNSL